MSKERLAAAILLAVIVGMMVSSVYMFGLAVEGVSKGVSEWLGG